MSLRHTLVAGLIALTPGFAFAQVMIEDAYARVGSAMAQSGAVFMHIHNHSGTDIVLVSASSDVAERVELHTHTQDAAGVMRMVKIEGGIPVPAQEGVMLERGGLHVMLLGLTRSLEHGDSFSLTLEFQNADPVTLDVTVDLERTPDHGGGHGQGHGHGG